MAFFLGQVVGGLIILWLISLLVEKFLFSKVLDDPVTGKLASVGAAWLLVGTISGFGKADGGPWDPTGFIDYLIPAVILGGVGVYRGLKLREQTQLDALAAAAERERADAEQRVSIARGSEATEQA